MFRAETARLLRVKASLRGADIEFPGVNTRWTRVTGRLSGVPKRLFGVETPLLGATGRLSGVETRLLGMPGRLFGVNTPLFGVPGQLFGVEPPLSGVTERLFRLLVPPGVGAAGCARAPRAWKRRKAERRGFVFFRHRSGL